MGNTKETLPGRCTFFPLCTEKSQKVLCITLNNYTKTHTCVIVLLLVNVPNITWIDYLDAR